jgi:chromosome segregation ATPase
MGKTAKTETETETTSDQPNEPPATRDAPQANAEDARIAQQRARALEDSSAEKAQKLALAEAKVHGLEGELTKARERIAELEQQVEQLSVDVAKATTAAKNAGAKIDGLPEGAVQLNESVTFFCAHTRQRLSVKARDVLFAAKSDDEVADLQRQLGQQATVHRVSRKDLEQLSAEGFIG